MGGGDVPTWAGEVKAGGVAGAGGRGSAVAAETEAESPKRAALAAARWPAVLRWTFSRFASHGASLANENMSRDKRAVREGDRRAKAERRLATPG